MNRWIVAGAAFGALVWGVSAQAACRDRTPPAPTPHRFVTDSDNENNAGTGIPDADMDRDLYDSDSAAPIEFNIDIPADPSRFDVVLKICAHDVDAVQGEVDAVYLNGVDLGNLQGRSGRNVRTDFVVPPGVAHQGLNLVQVLPDPSGGWAVGVSFGVIALKPPSAAKAAGRAGGTKTE